MFSKQIRVPLVKIMLTGAVADGGVKDINLPAGRGSNLCCQ